MKQIDVPLLHYGPLDCWVEQTRWVERRGTYYVVGWIRRYIWEQGRLKAMVHNSADSPRAKRD